MVVGGGVVPGSVVGGSVVGGGVVAGSVVGGGVVAGSVVGGSVVGGGVVGWHATSRLTNRHSSCWGTDWAGTHGLTDNQQSAASPISFTIVGSATMASARAAAVASSVCSPVDPSVVELVAVTASDDG
jgi:hypothetical protein